MDLAKLHLHWRTSHYKGNSYRSYSLARAYREHGKNRKEIVLKLGRLSNDEAQRWRSLLQTVKKPGAFLTTLDDLVVTRHYAYLDVASASAVWDHWRLNEAFAEHGNRDVGIETIARILVVNRCIDPAAKSQAPLWLRNTALPWLLNLNPHSINASDVDKAIALEWTPE